MDYRKKVKMKRKKNNENCKLAINLIFVFSTNMTLIDRNCQND